MTFAAVRAVKEVNMPKLAPENPGYTIADIAEGCPANEWGKVFAELQAIVKERGFEGGRVWLPINLNRLYVNGERFNLSPDVTGILKDLCGDKFNLLT